jgi:hypothetical protein
MKKSTVFSIIFILLCCLVGPIALFGSTTYEKAHKKAVTACIGKKAGDSVEFINKWNKRIKGICLEKNGTLIAISAKKLAE